MNTGEYELALFPLNSVLFPAASMALRIFEPRYVDLVGRCMRDNAGFGVIAIMKGSETGRPAATHDIGTVARIIDFDQGSDGLLNIVIRGDERFELRATRIQLDQLSIGTVADLVNVAELPIPREFQFLAGLLENIVANANADEPSIPTPGTASQLAYALAPYLPLTVAAKVALLKIGDPLELLKDVARNIRDLRHLAQ